MSRSQNRECVTGALYKMVKTSVYTLLMEYERVFTSAIIALYLSEPIKIWYLSHAGGQGILR